MSRAGKRTTPSTKSKPTFAPIAMAMIGRKTPKTASASAVRASPDTNATADSTVSSNQRGTAAPSARLMTGPYGTGRCRTGSCT